MVRRRLKKMKKISKKKLNLISNPYIYPSHRNITSHHDEKDHFVKRYNIDER